MPQRERHWAPAVAHFLSPSLRPGVWSHVQAAHLYDNDYSPNILFTTKLEFRYHLTHS